MTTRNPCPSRAAAHDIPELIAADMVFHQLICEAAEAERVARRHAERAADWSENEMACVGQTARVGTTQG